MGYGFFLTGLFFIFFRNELESKGSFGSLTLLAFLSFLGFQFIRFIWAVWQVLGRGLTDSATLPLMRYLEAPLEWLFFLACFVLSFWFFFRRSSVGRLLWTLSLGGFFLALNAVSPLLIHGKAGYSLAEGGRTFFYPLFYSHSLLQKYVFSPFGHPNYMGDFTALGFFAGLGLFFYLLQRLIEQRKKGASIDSSASWALLGLVFIMTATNAAATVLFLGRGTLICFFFASLVYFFFLFLKYRSRTVGILILIVLLLSLGFIYWVIDWSVVFREIQTINKEFDPAQVTSFSTNREAAERALTIYRVHPLWGVGTDGYAAVSELFATAGTEALVTAKIRAMSHYLTLLAEEGGGAYLYFLFLLFYFWEIAKGLWGIQSRFQFLSGLSLAASALMFFAHAGIFYTLQLFSVSSLLYVLMGASLGILRRDFKHT